MQHPPGHGPPPYPPTPPGPPPNHGRRVATGVGLTTIVALVALSLLGPIARGCNAKMSKDKREIEASLPKVGAEGTLAHASSKASLCPADRFSFGWPCGRGGTAVDATSRVRVMKAGVHQMEGVCRYWVLDGAQANASGDAPCEWFEAR